MKRFNVTVNGVTYDVTVEEIGGAAPAPVAAPAPAAAPVAAAAPAAAPVAAAPVAPAGAAGSVEVKAPLQGTVMKVLVKPGDSVTKGSPVCVIEALKMENDVPAPADGVVASINVKSGDSVKTDEVLLTLN
ncbi:MAG: biotin/lipoyl-binding protein [Ruminococcaceae bacterium]|nr:biotin/lipoyl-binding protein [Oscillospiraceae bacterium]